MIPEAKHRATLHMVLSGPHSGLQNFVPRSGQNRKINFRTQMKPQNHEIRKDVIIIVFIRFPKFRNNLCDHKSRRRREKKYQFWGCRSEKNLDLFT